MAPFCVGSGVRNEAWIAEAVVKLISGAEQPAIRREAVDFADVARRDCAGAGGQKTTPRRPPSYMWSAVGCAEVWLQPCPGDAMCDAMTAAAEAAGRVVIWSAVRAG